jgi:hypothetical protein
MKQEFDKVSTGWIFGLHYNIGNRYLRCSTSDEHSYFKYGERPGYADVHPIYRNTLTLWLFKNYYQVWW